MLTIQVPSQFFYEWLEEHYVSVLKLAIETELGITGKLEYSIIVDKGDAINKPYTVNLPTSKFSRKNQQNGLAVKNINLKSPFEKKEYSPYRIDSHLKAQYGFDSYIEGDCNRLARSAGIAVANNPGVTSFNPLVIYGGVGLGKTHLVQALGNAIKENDPNKFVLYVSSEKFTNQVVDAFKNNSLQDFMNYYLQIDVLIVDDVQFFAGKEKTQEIYFHIFNHLHQSGKQVVMTSDCAPKDLKGLDERLLSRFKWGLTADLQKPDLETKMSIIHKKIERDGITIPERVIEYLAYSVDSNIRELEGVLISLIAQASLNKKEIDLELAKQTLNNIVKDIETEVGIDYIQKFVSEYYNVALDLLKAKTRKREIVVARQVAMYLAKQYTNMSLKSIGFHFGNRDHSTVIHAISTVNDMMDTDKRFHTSMEDIQKKFKLKAIG